MSSVDSLTNDKFLGAFLGAVVGDSLGWPNEDRSGIIQRLSEEPNKYSFRLWVRRSGGKFYSHEELIHPGEYSDDSQLLIATARSLTYGTNWSKHFLKVELPAWLIYERGGGGATKRAAKCWSRGIPPWRTSEDNLSLARQYFEAGGNGVAMRILPHVFKRTSLKELSLQVCINGMYTHGHPRALLGAILYARAIRYLIDLNEQLSFGGLIEYLLETIDEWSEFPELKNVGEWKESARILTNDKYTDIWALTVEELKNGLMIAREGIRLGVLDTGTSVLQKLDCFNPSSRGSGTVASLVSIYLASKYAADPQTGLHVAASLKKADTDTIASMVGGLLGAIHGTEWFRPEWLRVQDFYFIRKLIANDSVTDVNSDEIRLWSDNDNERFKKNLRNLVVGDSVLFGPFRKLTLREIVTNKSNVKNLDVSTYKFSSEFEQIVFIKSFSKSNPDNKREETTQSKYSDSVNEQMIRVSGGRSIALDLERLKMIQRLAPSKLSARKLSALMSDILNRVSHGSNISEGEKWEIARGYINKGISEMELSMLISYIKEHCIV